MLNNRFFSALAIVSVAGFAACGGDDSAEVADDAAVIGTDTSLITRQDTAIVPVAVPVTDTLMTTTTTVVEADTMVMTDTMRMRDTVRNP